MSRPTPGTATGFTSRLLGIVLAVLALHFGRPFLMPLALAALFCFLLTPLARLMNRRLRIPRAASAVLAVILTGGVAFGVGWLVVDQALDFVDRYPDYRRNVIAKVDNIRDAAKPIQSVTEKVEKVSEELEAREKIEQARKEAEAERDEREAEAAVAREAPEALPPEPEPAKVEVVERKPTGLSRWRPHLDALVHFVLVAGVVLVLTLFMMIYLDDLRDRVVRIVGHGDVVAATQALDDATGLVSRYLLTTLLINLSYGIPVGIGLWVIGVPNAFLWGLLATVLRFVPYVGPWVAAAMPTALAFAIFDGWGTLLQVLGLFVALELISNNVVEPLMYGRRTGMSPFAVFVAVLFWTWIWGPVGLIVAIPTTLCLAVAGRYVPGLAWLHIALSGEASLDAPTRFFQRLVAMDPEAAESETIETVREGGLVSFHDELFLPALRLTEIRSQRGSLDPERRAFILRELEEIADVAEREAEPDPEALEHPSRAAIEILCIPSNGPADVTAARGLASVLHHAGFDRARVFGEEKLVGSLVDEVEALQPDLVFFVALPPGAVRRIRYRCKRLREALPRLPIGGFAWHPTREASGSPESVEESGATEGLVSFEEALDMARRVGAAVRRADARGEPLELGAE